MCCLIAFVVAVQAAREVELAKLGTACPCRHLTSLTVGSVHELPAGTVIPPATEADPSVVSYTQKPSEAVVLATRFGMLGIEEVKAAFGGVAATVRKGH